MPPKSSSEDDETLEAVRLMNRLKRARRINLPASAQLDLAMSDLTDDHLDEIRDLFA